MDSRLNGAANWRFVLVFACVLGPPAIAADIAIRDMAAWQTAMTTVRSGDRLILREGEWRDANLVFIGRGSSDAPITLTAAVPGKTVLTGTSTLRIGGQYLVVDGLSFKDPSSDISDLIQFRKDSKQLAQHCRLTNCAVISTLTNVSSQESRWVGLYGDQHRVDHCTFQGKSGKGTTFVVWLGDANKGEHLIDHNYFGPRERLGKNGGETIRIGDSETSMLTGGCVVEANLFEKCNGEAECISNKSCGNVYAGNTFLEVSGTLTLRHGNRCVVERNVFLGNKVSGSGGIRIIGEDHIVRSNYLEKLAGDDARSAICLMMGIPNSPLNRYFQVQRALVENNTIVDCEHSILIGLSDDKNASLPPIDTVFSGNRILSPSYSVVEGRCSLDGIVWKANQFSGKALGIPAEQGISTSDPTIIKLEPISRSDVGTSW